MPVSPYEKVILVVDSNALCHRVKHTMKDLSYHEQRTGIIFGFLNYVLKYAKMWNTNRFVFCWDSGKSARRSLFPQYKEKRKNNQKNRTSEEEEFYRLSYVQFGTLRAEVLPSLGFKNNFIQTGREADDIIASVVNTLYASYHGWKTILLTSDQDLFQLLDKCDYLSLYSKKARLFTMGDFHQQYNIHPKQWVEVKAIAGCSTDEVPGVKNVGEDRVIKYLTGKLVKGKIYDSIVSVEGLAIKERNLPLVSLPMEGTKEFQMDFDEYFPLQSFYNVCDKYGFSSFTRGVKLEDWQRLFKME